MKIIDPGHHFRLDQLDAPENQPVVWGADLRFVKREGPGYPGNVGHHEGTNIQEVLRALISRVQYLENQISHSVNEDIVWDLRRALYRLEYRAAERHGRLDAFLRTYSHVLAIELEPTCKRCGHVGCDGTCHSHG